MEAGHWSETKTPVISNEKRTLVSEEQPIPSSGPGQDSVKVEVEDGDSIKGTLHHDVNAPGDVPRGSKRESQDGSRSTIIVDWEGKDDPECPLNWTFRHKW